MALSQNFASTQGSSDVQRCRSPSYRPKISMDSQVHLGESATSADQTGNIIVKNLDPSIDTKALYAAFSPFGPILSCKVPQGKNGSKRHGFVHFTSVTSACEAVDALNGSVFGTKKIYVSHFQSRNSRASPNAEGCDHPTTSSSMFPCQTVYLNNVSPTADVSALKLLCDPFGEISSIKIIRDADGSSKGFAFITFQSFEDAAMAIHSLNGKEVDERVLFAGPAKKRIGKRPFHFPQAVHQELPFVVQQQPQQPQGPPLELFHSSLTPVSNEIYLPPSKELDQPYHHQFFRSENTILKHHQHPQQQQQYKQIQHIQQNFHYEISQQPNEYNKPTQHQKQTNSFPVVNSADKELLSSAASCHENGCDSQKSSQNKFSLPDIIYQIPKQTRRKELQELPVITDDHHSQFLSQPDSRVNSEVFSHLDQQPKCPGNEVYETDTENREPILGTPESQKETAIHNQKEIQITQEMLFQDTEIQCNKQPDPDPDPSHQTENLSSNVENSQQQQPKYVTDVQNQDQQQQTDNNVKLQKQTQTPNGDQTMKFQLQRYQRNQQHQQQALLPQPFLLSLQLPGSVCPLQHTDEFHPHFYHQHLNQERTTGAGAISAALPHMDLLCIPQCHFNADLQHGHNVVLCGDAKPNQIGYDHQPLLNHIDWQLHKEQIQGHLAQQQLQQQQQPQQQKIMSFPNPYFVHPMIPLSNQNFPKQTPNMACGQTNAMNLQERIGLLQQYQNQHSRLIQPHQQRLINAETAMPSSVPQGVNLYVKHLDEHVDDSMLRKMFSRFGEVVSAKVMMEGNKSRGFGFVCFARAEDAARATRDIRRKGDDINKKQLYVAPAQRKEERQAFFREKLKSRLWQTPCGFSQENDPKKKLIVKEVNSLTKKDPEEEIVAQNVSGDEEGCPVVSTARTKDNDEKALKLPDELMSFIKDTDFNSEPIRNRKPCLSGLKSLQIGQVEPPKKQLFFSLILECLDAARLQTPLIRPSPLADFDCARGTKGSAQWSSEAQPIPSSFFDHGNEVLVASLASVLNPLRGKPSSRSCSLVKTFNDLDLTVKTIPEESTESSQDQGSLALLHGGENDQGSPQNVEETSQPEYIHRSFHVNENQPTSAFGSQVSALQPKSTTLSLSTAIPCEDNVSAIVIRSDPPWDYTSKEWPSLCDPVKVYKTPAVGKNTGTPQFQVNGQNYAAKMKTNDEFPASVDYHNSPFSKHREVAMSPAMAFHNSFRFKNQTGQFSCSPDLGWDQHPFRGVKRALSFSDSNSWGMGERTWERTWENGSDTFAGFHRQSLKRRWCSSFEIASGRYHPNGTDQGPWSEPWKRTSSQQECSQSFSDREESALFADPASVLPGSSKKTEHGIRETPDSSLNLHPFDCSSSAPNSESFSEQIWDGDMNFLSGISCMTSDQQKMVLSETVKSHVINLTQTMWKEQDERIQPFLVLLVDNWTTSEVVEKLAQMILELDVGEILNCLLSRQTLRSLVKEGLDQMLSSLSKYFDISVAFAGNSTLA